MRVLIAEDEPLARSLLRTLLMESAGIEIIGEARSGSEAVALAGKLRPDAIFLDIDMPGGGGIGAAHQLQSRMTTEIVFVTAHEPHAVDAFELGAADYVLKPVRRLRLAQAIERVRARVRERRLNGADDAAAPESAFWVRTRCGRMRLPCSEILRIEAARDHVCFYTASQSYFHRATMEELEGKLKGSGLVRVQRSVFVRLDMVTSIVRHGKALLLELSDGARVAVGPSYQARTLAALTGETGPSRSFSSGAP